jgi:hypothetical protein
MHFVPAGCRQLNPTKPGVLNNGVVLKHPSHMPLLALRMLGWTQMAVRSKLWVIIDVLVCAWVKDATKISKARKSRKRLNFHIFPS